MIFPASVTWPKSVLSTWLKLQLEDIVDTENVQGFLDSHAEELEENYLDEQHAFEEAEDMRCKPAKKYREKNHYKSTWWV